MHSIRLAVIGTGAIGRTHLVAIKRTPGMCVSGIIEPSADGVRFAHQHECALYRDVDELLADRPEGVVVATPNNLHVPIGIALLEAGIPILVEKPIAENADMGLELVEASLRAGVPGLVGHHRRYNPIIRAAKAQIDSGQFGDLIMGSLSYSLFKPQGYFDLAWRSEPGNGGPLLINLIHEVDLLRHLFGPILTVSAITSNAQRNLAVEDTAAVIFAFAKGGIVSAVVSDAAVGPWAWDLAAGENLERFPAHPVTSHTFCGTQAGISLPDLTLWRHKGVRDWTRRLESTVLKKAAEDSYDTQIKHFKDVIMGVASPMVSLRDGYENLRIIEGIQRSARQGRTVSFDVSVGVGTSASKSMEVQN